MLRIVQQTSATNAQSYYTTADYYTEGKEVIGQWRGKGAERLGLVGEIQKKDWDALCVNTDPSTGQSLTKYTRSERRVGYDLNWHVPKSLSLLYAQTGDERLIDAIRDAVRATMADIASEVQTRVRKSGNDHDRITGNLIWGEFIHTTSRPVNGVPDPHLHVHAFAMNATWDEQERRWKALQLGTVKSDAKYFEQCFHSRLAGSLADLGLAVERTRTGWELADVARSALPKFSLRTAQIEAEAAKRGITNDAQKDGLGAKTREKKHDRHSFNQLRALWNDRLSDAERDSIATASDRIGGPAVALDDKEASTDAVAFATKHLFERKAVVRERELFAHALKHAVGKSRLEDVLSAARDAKLLRGTLDGRAMVSTPEVLAEEQGMLAFAKTGRGAFDSFAPDDRAFHRTFLSPDQKQAVTQVLKSKDAVTLFRGIAGTGKTTAMSEVVTGIKAGGAEVFAFAPSAEASRDLLRAAGFENADTVAKLLQDAELQKSLSNSVIWIDEAGQVGTPTMAKVFELAERHHARVLLSGDVRQHAAVERGSPMDLLEREAGLKTATLKDIRRQKGAYKAAIAALADGRIAEGFGRLDDLHWIEEVSGADRYHRLAKNYAAALLDGKSALVVSPTHIEGERTQREIRAVLGESGLLDRDNEEILPILRSSKLTEAERSDATNYLPGDVLVFHRNAKGFKAGERLVVGANGTVGDRAIPHDQSARFDLCYQDAIPIAPGEVVRITRNGKTLDGHRLNNGTLHTIKGFDRSGNLLTKEGWTIPKDYGHLTHGYVSTSHASQGKSVDRVFIAQSAQSIGAASMKQFYVSASRGQESVKIYTDDKQELLHAVSRDEVRLSATDLFGRPSKQRRTLVTKRQREKQVQREKQQARDRSEVSLER